ncbi:MAG: nucleotidyltransferase [Nitrospirae bacterium RBG_13_39_12]|nr:MAG: nucleotidyltransferase [Nitrospirae bacterium RBG_13_39_12]
MKNLDEIKNIIAKNMDILKSQYKVKEIGVFGSYVRGKPKKKSDIDILVTFRRSVDFIEFLQLEEYLATLLGVKVDLVTKEALKPYIGKRILEEVVYV